MNAAEHLQSLFDDSIRTHQQAAAQLPSAVAAAGSELIRCLRGGGTVLTCGNGGSAADAQHLAAELVVRFEREREGLPALALTTDTSILTAAANDLGFDQVFARPVRALARSGDVLLALTTSGNSANVEHAIDAIHDRGGTVVLLSGRSGGRAARMLRPGDIEVRAPGSSTARIQEVHLLVLHALCSLIDLEFERSPRS